VPYTLSSTQTEFLRNRFPGTVFRSSDDRLHDHPIAHTSTMVGIRQLQRMLMAGSTSLDIYGNPQANEAFNWSQRNSNRPKTIGTLVWEFTPKDALRRLTKWGPPVNAQGQPRYLERRLENVHCDLLDGFDNFISIHTLYYLSRRQICRLLHNETEGLGSRFLALFHRFPEANGTLNNGEQSYSKDNLGTVRQVNVHSSVSYEHPDVEWAFSPNKVYQDPEFKTAFVWECHMVCDGLWIMEATRCRYDYGPTNILPYCDAYDSTITLETAKVFNAGPVCIKLGSGDEVELNISNRPLYDRLRQHMVGKPRNPETLRDLFVVARRLISPGQLFPGTEGINIPPDVVVDHVVASYLANTGHELNALKTVSNVSALLSEHGSLLKGSTLFSLDDFYSVFRGLVNVGSVGYRAYRSTDPVGKVFNALQ